MRFYRRISRGTFTIPIDVREVFGIQEGDLVDLEVRLPKKQESMQQESSV